MDSIETMTRKENGCTAALARIRRGAADVNALSADTAHSEGFKSEVRTKTVAKMREDLAELRILAANAKAQRVFWQDRALLMSLQRFDPDAGVDAQIRVNYRAELAAMPLPLLSLTMKSAMDDAKAKPTAPAVLARVWACVQAGRAAAAGRLPDWSSIEIPDQRDVLAKIDVTAAALAEGELVFGAVSGAPLTSMQRLTIGHSKPAATSRPSSPGRPDLPNYTSSRRTP